MRYRIRRSLGTWSAPLELDPVLGRWTTMAGKMGGPYRLREQEDPEWSFARSLKDTRARLREVLADGVAGEVWLTDTSVEAHVITRIVEFTAPDGPGTSAIDQCLYRLVQRFGPVETWGICVCKRVAPGAGYSQHAACNAVDLHATFDKMDVMARWCVAQAKRDLAAFPASEVIFNRRIATQSQGWTWRPYSGLSSHTDHIHLSGHPLVTAGPWTACAG